ncbi:hypothetical protein HERIO_663 [Hepatospora eriocheir]|uniref:Uncharacterized protein n=1 Tax=Hepatospora eriocheir TaxID=1081669 RepID=A0A1X0QCL8_9MICR|nr:hypothetical protein HERIO_663 [Hepatospora eriocheir]
MRNINNKINLELFKNEIDSDLSYEKFKITENNGILYAGMMNGKLFYYNLSNQESGFIKLESDNQSKKVLQNTNQLVKNVISYKNGVIGVVDNKLYKIETE